MVGDPVGGVAQEPLRLGVLKPKGAMIELLIAERGEVKVV
jgi:hypothetical protein